MPELPEVQSAINAIKPSVVNQKIADVIIRNHKLREPIPEYLPQHIINETINSVERRAKYIIIHLNKFDLIVHLGMSGSLTLTSKDEPIKKHSHLDIILNNHKIIRYTDPRKFGMVLLEKNYLDNKYIQKCGIEPFSDEFKKDYLYNASRNKKMKIKTFLMKNDIVVGVGNIYASECLFKAGIKPDRAASDISIEEYRALSKIIVSTLKNSIKNGGTTLRDHQIGNNIKGNNQDNLLVYGKKICSQCHNNLKTELINNRNTYFCSNCQR